MNRIVGIGWTTRTRIVSHCGAIALLGAAAATAQCPVDWELSATTGPAVRSYHGMAFDSLRGTSVLYGGANNSTLRQDLWEWNGAAWSQIAATNAPGPRRGMGMTFDDGRDRIVVFGGVTSGGMNAETWEWDSSAWTQMAIGGTSPSARGFMPLVFDTTNQACVLFGGWGSGLTYFDETWTWDGVAWTQQFPELISPSARAFHAAAYDAARGRIVLFGGLFNTSSSSTYYGDTWEWDGTNWHEVTPTTSPPARAYHAMAYDADRQRVVLFGGFEFNHGGFDDTWEWDGAAWVLRAPTSAPTLRWNHAMAYDPQRGETLLFGGQLNNTTRNDTWIYRAAALMGDLNGDGRVDLADLSAQLAHFGTTGGATLAEGDTDGDGDVDLADLSLLLGHFGQICS